MAALTPLRSLGDPLARAWSYELARRSGEAILEVAVLFDETNATDRLSWATRPRCCSRTARRWRGPVIRTAPRPLSAGRWRFPRRGRRRPDAALALFRIAAADPRAPATAVPEALHALALACADDPTVAAAAAREEALHGWRPDGRSRRSPATASSSSPSPGRGRPPQADASTIVRHFLAGMRLRDHGAVATRAARDRRGGRVGRRCGTALRAGARARPGGWGGRRRSDRAPDLAADAVADVSPRRSATSRRPMAAPGRRPAPTRAARGPAGSAARSAVPWIWRRRWTPSAAARWRRRWRSTAA